MSNFTYVVSEPRRFQGMRYFMDKDSSYLGGKRMTGQEAKLTHTGSPW